MILCDYAFWPFGAGYTVLPSIHLLGNSLRTKKLELLLEMGGSSLLVLCRFEVFP